MTAGTLLLAWALDVAVGDPRWLPHPVRGMGWAISWAETAIRRAAFSRWGERIGGLLLAVCLPLLTYGTAVALMAVGFQASPMAGRIVEIVLAFTTLASRDLADHASDVASALRDGSLEQARTAVARVVGRDADTLDEPGVVRASVETIAESTADGIIAPLFYLALGGAPLALAYKAVSTLDSMIGHHEPPYQDIGWASARLDDVLNWIPARLSALCLIVAAGAIGYSGAATRAWRVYRQDRACHPSPNSGHPEAAMAGALGVQLGGRNYYGGVAVDRPIIGEPHRPLDAERIGEAVRLMWMASGLAAMLAIGCLWL